MRLTRFPTPVPDALRGRGAAVNIAHRFETLAREPFDDGWSGSEPDAAPAPRPRTVVIDEQVRSVITRVDSPDLGFEHSINPYRGCEHGCSYCYARPTHSYLGLSPGLDFETRIIAKRNIATVLRAELLAPGYAPRALNVGSATDAYQPIERDLRLTRSVIELLAASRHPFSLITKGSGVERDLDLIAPAAARGGAAVYVTITTLDAALARRMEPRAASPQRRLRVIETLARAGVPVGVSVAPQIPFLNEDMEQVLEAAWVAGARRAFYTVMRLPWELSPLFQAWLQAQVPERAGRIMARIREMRGGADYDSDFATRMKGEGLWADLLRRRFEHCCRKLGYGRDRTEMDLSAFRPSALLGQGDLFG